MDIEILLALQRFRVGPGGALTGFFTKMTFFGELNTAIVVLAVIYWCINREFGAYLLTGFGMNRLVNGMLKVTACVYRPWIRDPRMMPEPAALASASGYSFPSGHSMNAATAYGGAVPRKDLPRALRVSSGVLGLLVAFSRNFLGVHTPQDILVGSVSGLLVMFLIYELLIWLRAHPEMQAAAVCAGVAASVAVALYAGLKSYPVDYDEAGKILVDGAKMANDTFKGVGYSLAVFTGVFLERRFVRFSTDISMAKRVTRCVCGLLGYYALNLIAAPLIVSGIPGPAGTVVSRFIPLFYIAFLFPLLIRKFEREETGDGVPGGDKQAPACAESAGQ